MPILSAINVTQALSNDAQPEVHFKSVDYFDKKTHFIMAKWCYKLAVMPVVISMVTKGTKSKI